MTKLKSILLAASALAGSLLCSAQDVTLASWTFETGYDVTALDGTNNLYTPNGQEAANSGAQWFNSSVPHILPESAAGDASAYDLSAYSEGRYWELTAGYGTRVFRVENTVENVTTDFTNPANHKCYYQLTFPTTGYKDIAVTYSIAPGNNAVTPVEMVVSTDGGTTWFDSGALNTSETWFTYQNVTARLAVNDKPSVMIRLLPTVGTTNWNLSNLAITGSEADQLPSASNDDITFQWPLGTTTPPSGAEASIPGLFSLCELSVGSGLTITKTANLTGAKPQTLFKPATSNASSPVADEALVMTIAPKRGITFKPTGFSFEASRHGTDGGVLVLEVSRGDKTVTINNNLTPTRNNQTPPFTSFSEAITGFDASAEPLQVRLYIIKLGNTKEIGLAGLTLTGVANGQVLPVPTYSFSMTSAVEGAGALSCSPAGNEFDEGTRLTVSAGENFGYHFTGWTDAEGTLISNANPYSFEIMADTHLVANYDVNDVYALKVALEGGANVNQVIFTPEGNVVDGIHYYEAGTDVMLSTVNNRILTFTSWDDNSTAPEREVRMDGEKNLTANFSACDYIVGWDFYFDNPASERAADFKDESDNAGLLSLRDPAGNTTTWLPRGIERGSENGKWAARIWKLRSAENYFEVSFSTMGYTNVIVSAALGISYNSYCVNNMQYSTDGTNFTTVGTYNLQRGWTSNEFQLPAEADNQPRVWVRFMPDRTSDLVGSETDYDGLAIAELFILADKESASDSTAPQLVSVIPADGSTGASATGSIVLTFDEKVVRGTGNATLNGEIIEGNFSGKTVIYNYAGLSYATPYTFTLPAAAITDRSGNAFAGTSLSFTTMERTQPEARLMDAIVAADGSGDFTSIQDAIDAAPAGRVKPWLIFVKSGRYTGHVDIPASKTRLHFIGQDRDNTVIADNRLCGGENAYHVSQGATVVVNANDCMFENITLENTHGHVNQSGPQALALNTTADRTVFNNVAMLSYQDTWITPSTSNYRAYVRNSFIEGAVDFIYNSGNIYIDNTTLYINRKDGGFIVAPSHDTDVQWGYVFNNCTITAPGVPSATTVWLGRPWHNYPKTVFLNTRAEVTIPATGWYETMGGLPAIWADWNTVDGNGNPVDLSQRRDTYYYTDSNGNRVYGTAKNHLTDEEAAEYTTKNVLSGSDNWEPVIMTEPCDAPVAVAENGVITWDAVPYAICYLVTRDNEVAGFTTEPEFSAPDASTAAYYVQAVNEFGGLSAKARATDPASIAAAAADSNFTVEGYYDLRGIRLEKPVTGVNIVKMIDAAGNVKVEKAVIR